MTLRRLLIRSIAHYWMTSVVVVFGVAVATAVITGSLLVGDSVSGSIRDTALARLGSGDAAGAEEALQEADAAPLGGIDQELLNHVRRLGDLIGDIHPARNHRAGRRS